MSDFVNERGNRVKGEFVGPYRNRYHYDMTLCSSPNGWVQYDTDQDASYFGVWVNRDSLEIITFAEGDESYVTCPTAESFAVELANMVEFYGDPPPAFTVIDSNGQVTKHYSTRPTGVDAESV